DGASAAVGRPTLATFAIAAVLAALISTVCGLYAEVGLLAVAAAILIACALTSLISYWSLRAIGGQTGDVAGACQQLAEIGFYMGLVVVMNRGLG
ncbi:MAG: adenosylcobinamide-GDP ribazoletransferase, partial [Beijerinckiaceae bacterium]